MRWDLWTVLKDILLTGTGMAVIFSQVLSPRPSDVLLVTGLALTTPSVAGHTVALLRGPTERHSSPPSASSSPPRSSSSPSGEPGE